MGGLGGDMVAKVVGGNSSVSGRVVVVGGGGEREVTILVS